MLSALPRSKHPSRNRLKDPLRRTHATLLLERSPLDHDGYAIALKLFNDFWSYLAVTLLLSSHQ
ncbi:hypothetical protein [Nostoc sp. C110]|uniref:hypothetical protein n=1 Tax=Nostoc sp. C110 TaxID=3349876 RepID=UPI00370D5BBF